MKPGAELVAKILDGQRVAATGTVVFNQQRAWLELRLMNPRKWSPETPNLYEIEYELRQGGQTVDRVKSYFGYRVVGIEAGQFVLNGRPYFLKMVLDQGYWPESTITAPTDAALKYDIEAMKQMGFNGARKHQKVEDPRYLYWADKLGFLVSDEMANAQQFDETYVARFTREWIDVVERDYNHPSVVMWIPINESWGVPDARDARQQAHLRANYHLTKALDGSRPVIENDGWEHVDTTDLYGLHDYARTGEALFSKYKTPPAAGGQWPANGRMAAVPPYRSPGGRARAWAPESSPLRPASADFAPWRIHTSAAPAPVRPFPRSPRTGQNSDSAAPAFLLAPGRSQSDPSAKTARRSARGPGSRQAPAACRSHSVGFGWPPSPAANGNAFRPRRPLCPVEAPP